ncbi:hypothetical protein [Amycolatopsis jejuensis]|uniref:hypothetical protein n=1 Tax=Amycolatopsis jejuensis TaxID=330084 RepID=UPI001FDEA966|nr:hypothetical protein [Amycolatopsis jejuensis]
MNHTLNARWLLFAVPGLVVARRSAIHRQMWFGSWSSGSVGTDDSRASELSASVGAMGLASQKRKNLTASQ